MPADPKLVRRLFNQALDQKPEERERWLATACAGDAELLNLIQVLLAAHAEPASVLEKPMAFDAPHAPTGDFVSKPTEHKAPAPSALGALIAGKYKLLEIIGEGGMGTVYMAQQVQPVKRYVAVKLVKPGMDSKQVLARFEAERQALAVMDHPNIARVYDAGMAAVGSRQSAVDNRISEPTADSLLPTAEMPFFVMELVKGIPITKFCDERRLTPRERLELFVPVCNAIQHAHQKGIIHRDIKPTNVLVALYDDRPVPKVIDFGIAKAAGQQLTELTLHTGFGAVVGTPEYMSPEQASFNQLDVDTRSDIYSLGVLLYELLTGSPPLSRQHLEKAGLMEMLRVVREVEPPKPSTKISSSDMLPSLGANRKTEPRKLSALVRGEIDWIVMKSLEKDRSRRYETANGFAADVQRYLSGEAVLAAPPSASYRLKKFLRKNRGPAIAGGLVSLALIAGMGGTTWGFILAKRETQHVLEEKAKSQTARDAAELNLVHSYLRPIGYNTQGIDQAELVALDDLAQQEDDRVKLLFLKEALNDGERALRIARRAERVVQAAIGTSLKRRSATLDWVIPLQSDPKADPRSRLAATWIAIELGSADIVPLEGHFETLLKEKNFEDWHNLIDDLAWRIHPTKRDRLFVSLVSLIGKLTNYHVLSAAWRSMAALAPHRDAASARAGFDALVSVLGKISDPNVLFEAGSGLEALAPHVDASSSLAGFNALVAILGKTVDDNVSYAAARALLALAPRVDRVSARAGFDAFVVVLGKTKDRDALDAAGSGLAALAPFLDEASARAGFDALVVVLGKSKDRDALYATGSGLAALAPFLDEASARAGFDALVVVLGKTKDGVALDAAGRGLAALAPRLDAASTQEGFDALVAALGKTKDGVALYAAGSSLAELAPRVDQASAKAAFDALIAVLCKTTDNNALNAVEGGLAALALRLDEASARDRFDALVTVLCKTTNNNALNAVGGGLAALAPRVNAAFARAGLNAFVGVLDKTADGYALYVVGGGVAALAPRLDEASARAGFDALVGVLGKMKDQDALDATGRGLAALASRLDEASARAGFVALVSVLGKTTDGNALDAAGRGLAALASRLDEASARAAFDTLIAVLDKPTDFYILETAGRGVAALAPRLDEASARAGFDAFVTVLGKMRGRYDLRAAGSGLAALAQRIDPTSARAAFDALVAILCNTTDNNALYATGSGLAALSPYVDALTAKAGFDALVGVLRRNEDTLKDVRNAFPALIRRLNPELRSPYAAVNIIEWLRVSPLNPNFIPWDDANDNPLEFIDRPVELAAIMQNPAFFNYAFDDGTVSHGCNLKDAVLLRLEELAYPNPAQAAVFASLAANPLSTLMVPAIKIDSDYNRKLNRRFRTVSDAALWLAEHHPEIDLEKPYNK